MQWGCLTGTLCVWCDFKQQVLSTFCALFGHFLLSAGVHNLVYMVAFFWFNDSIYGRARILARDGRLRINLDSGALVGSVETL